MGFRKICINENEPNVTVVDDTTTALYPSETIFGEHSEKTEALRYFRDNKLSKSPEGQELISLYYDWSPMIVKAIGEDEEFKEEVKDIIDELLWLIGGETE